MTTSPETDQIKTMDTTISTLFEELRIERLKSSTLAVQLYESCVGFDAKEESMLKDHARELKAKDSALGELRDTLVAKEHDAQAKAAKEALGRDETIRASVEREIKGKEEAARGGMAREMEESWRGKMDVELKHKEETWRGRMEAEIKRKEEAVTEMMAKESREKEELQGVVKEMKRNEEGLRETMAREMEAKEESWREKMDVELKHKEEAMTKEMSRVMRERDEYVDRVDDAVTTLKEDVVKHTEEARRAREELEATKEQASEMHAKLAMTEMELAQVRDMLGERGIAAEGSSKLVDEAQEEIKIARRDIDNLRSELGNELSSLRGQLAETQQLLKETRRLLSDREVASEGLQQTLDGNVKELENARNEVSKVRSELGQDLANSRNEREQESGDLRKLLAQRDSAAELLQRQLDESVKIAKDARLEMSAVRSEMGRLQEVIKSESEERIAQAEREVLQLKNLLSDREIAAEGLQITLDGNVKELELARNETSKLRSELGQDLANSRNEREQESTELRKLLAQRDAAAELSQTQLDASLKIAKDARLEISAVRSEMGRLQEVTKSETESRLVSRETEIVELKTLLGDREEASEGVQRKYDVNVKELEKSRNEASRLRSDLGQESAKVRAADTLHEEELKEMRRLLEQRNTAADQSRRTLDELQAETKKLRSEKQAIRSESGSELAELRAKIDELAKAEAASQSTAQQSIQEAAVAKADLEKVKKTLATLALSEHELSGKTQIYNKLFAGLVAVTGALALFEGRAKL